MIAEISAGLQSLKAAKDILQGLNAASTQAAVNEVKLVLGEKLLEAREALSAAHDAHSAALERVGRLEEDLAKLKNWEREKERYQLQSIGNGALIYSLKPGMEGVEPPHRICAACYQRGQKSILQLELWQPLRAEVLVCHECGAVYYVKGQPHADHKSLRPKGRA